MGAISSPRPRRWPHHESCIPSPFMSLTLSHWLHPAHFNLIFLSHVPCPSVDESVQLLPSDAGLKPRNISQRQNKQVRGKDHKTTGIWAKHKSFKYNICTRTHICLPLCTWAVTQEGGGCPCPVQKATPQQGPAGRGWDSVAFKQTPQHGQSSLPKMSTFWSQRGMRILIFDS